MVFIVGMIALVIIIIIISVSIRDWYDLFEQRECIHFSGDFFPSDFNKSINP